MSDWSKGQRCASKGEPTLGLGIIAEVNARQIKVFFPAVDADRVYAKDKAPLRRVIFEVGDTIHSNHGMQMVVGEVKEQNGIVIYLGEEGILPETELDDAIVFSRPDQQLLAGQINKPRAFDLRQRIWKMRSLALSSPVRGFVGPSIQLLPHQLYIAENVSKRFQPRVLLSDEVGLGKTIEAGLIFHRMFVTGAAKRVLILTPRSLVNQWLAEIYRKFNILFHLMDETQAKELKKSYPDLNPYEAHQCILQDIESASQNEDLRNQLEQSAWDLVIVDEAHHLQWSPDEVGDDYALVANIAARSGSLLLLTATPRSLGIESHFGRLHLLDPARFNSLEAFLDEINDYKDLAGIAEDIEKQDYETAEAKVEQLFPEDRDLIQAIQHHADETWDARQFLNELIDRHGTGRVVFRNQRKVMSNVPRRVVHPVRLDASKPYREFLEIGVSVLSDPVFGQRLLAGAPSFRPADFADLHPKGAQVVKRAWTQDPRLGWLLPFLRDNPEDKFLLICSQKDVVLALQEWLGGASDIKTAVFHEDLSLLERDRQAAYFAQPEGAQLLMCSEIGSEGRNFQFAHHLILFDLPLHPGMLEQRIGRLDRIGQTSDVNIHVPYVRNSPSAFLFRWYHEGLDAFENHLLEGDYLYEHLEGDYSVFFEVGQEPENLNDFIEQTRKLNVAIGEKLAQGRDRLLELHSYNEEVGYQILNDIKDIDADSELRSIMEAIFDHYDVEYESSLEGDIHYVRPTAQMSVTNFPGLPEEGMTMTYERDLAATREDISFMSVDHPMVTGAFEMLLQSDYGKTSFALWNGAPEPGILLQCMFILEGQAAEGIGLETYLPPTPILVSVDQNNNVRDDLNDQISAEILDKGPLAKLHQMREPLSQIVETLIQTAEQKAEEIAGSLVETAENRAMSESKAEYDRLKALNGVNPNVREDELEFVQERLEALVEHLDESRTRLEGVRLIMMVPKG